LLLDEERFYGDAGYQGFAKKLDMACTAAKFRVAMRSGKPRAIPTTPDGRLPDLIEAANAPVRATLDYPFKMIKHQFGSRKSGCSAWSLTTARSSYRSTGNLFLVRPQLLTAV
jgi:transposase, IS5 family